MPGMVFASHKRSHAWALVKFSTIQSDIYPRTASRGDRGWLSHGLVVTRPISYSLDGGTLWGFTRDMRIAA